VKVGILGICSLSVWERESIKALYCIEWTIVVDEMSAAVSLQTREGEGII
jgi:hypothetical protein